MDEQPVLEGCDNDGDGTLVYNCPNCNLDGIIALCKEKEEQLNLAGEYGLKLQEELQESQRHMDEMRIQHEAQVEGMIQENYELKIKLESVEKSMKDEKQIMKQTVDDFNIWKEKMVSESSEKANEFKKEKASSLAQLNQVQLRERQLNEQVNQLEEKNANLNAEKQKKREEVNISYSQEMFVLHENIITMEDVLEASKADNVKLRNENEMLSLSLQSLQTELVNKQKECEAAESKCTSYYNHLEKSREETIEVKSELEALKTQLKQSGHLKRGNSLFGEVEDERMMMEKNLKTMEVKYESLTKAYGFLKAQHHNLKSQVTALLSLHSGKADLDYIVNIERALSQVKSENAKLVSRLKVTQNDESEEINDQNIKELAKNLPNFESNEDVVEFLTIKLEESKSQLKKLHEELDQTHMVKMAESDKLLTAEQKLHETGVTAEKYKNANMKLRLKLEEAENKYKGENQKRILIEKKFNYDSSNDIEPMGIAPQQLKKSPPPFIKREQIKITSKKFNKVEEKKKFNKVEEKKINYEESYSADNWSEVLKTLQNAKDKKKCNGNVANVTSTSSVRKVKWSEDSDSPEKNVQPEGENKLKSVGFEENPSERTVSFKVDDKNDFPLPNKENNGDADTTQSKTEFKNRSCLKKPYANKNMNSYKESNRDISDDQNKNRMRVKDDQPCDIQ